MKPGVEKALYQRAKGYTAEEVVEEYVCSEEGGERLVRRKVAKKHVPADLAAIRYLDGREQPKQKALPDMTDAELNAERDRLLALLRQEEAAAVSGAANGPANDANDAAGVPPQAGREEEQA